MRSTPAVLGVLSLSLLPAHVHAQRLADLTPVAAAARTMAAVFSRESSATMRSGTREAAISPIAGRPASDRGRVERLAYAAGGVLLGTGVGFFAAEVAVSSWDDQPSDVRRRHRVRYSLSGATLGGIAGALIGAREGPRGAAEEDRGVYGAIGPDEIERARAVNAFELVSALRPVWLRTRGVDSPRETSSAMGGREGVILIPGATTVVVYLDNARVGGVDQLREIPMHLIESIDYMDARAATFRFGTGHNHGAIVVNTKRQ